MSAIVEHSQPQQAPKSRTIDFDLMGIRSVVGRVTRAFLKPWTDARRQPSDPEAAGMKARIMADRARPFEMVLRVMFAGVDAGFSVPSLVAWMPIAEHEVKAYAERRGRRLRSAGTLPFLEKWSRINAKAAMEDAESDAACWQVKESCRESLETARKELIDEKGSIDMQLAVIDEQLASLR